MQIAGIIAEYHPFHTGHAYHIEKTRQQLDPDCAIIAVTSGNWVQRGQCALIDKWTRAKWAVLGGVDLVLDLPTHFACATAETFARGGMEVLRATGIVTHLSFGCETGSMPELARLAHFLNSPAFHAEISQIAQEKTLSYATCRQMAACRALGEETGQLLSLPNANLAVEYLRHCGKEITPLPIPRIGTGHDAKTPENGFSSASALRALLEKGDFAAAKAFLPHPIRSDTPLARMAHGERAMLYALRSTSVDDWARLPDSGNGQGLCQRLFSAAQNATCLSDFYSLAKSRHITLARLRRLSIWAFLRQYQPNFTPQYLRPLAFNSRGRQLLSQIKEKGTLPILAKGADCQKLSPAAQTQFSTESYFSDLYTLFLPHAYPAGQEYRASPLYLPDERENIP